MAQDEQPPGGLLSKVVKFVRNPTVDWSELDQPEAKESHYSKQMLKEMIERKRANDFVRRREFDQLRKLRQRSALGIVGGGDAAGRPSFFQSSQPSDPGDRAGTLKKIDEIEAQMSRQWWKAKPQGQPTAESAPQPTGPQHARQYAATMHVSLADAAGRDTDFAATDISPYVPTAEPGFDDPLMAPGESLALAWPTAPATRDADQDMAHDPVLDEAAIRFANGDDAGAEAALSALLAGGAQTPVSAGLWMTLLDLFRATGQRERFEAAASDFSRRYGAAAPRWSAGSLPADQSALPGAAVGAPLHWASPTVLWAAEVARLQDLLDHRAPAVCELDWSRLTAIEDDALQPLATLLAAWTRQPIRLHVTGSEILDALLRRRTVSGERGTPGPWWLVRMEWLRITRRPDEFDLVALEYCITYEVAPPSWREAVCEWTDQPADASVPTSAAPEGGAAPVAACALVGVIKGDAAELLAAFDVEAEVTGPVVVDCGQLVRIDFAAAGSVLNWVVAQHSAGRQVELRGLHRLVAAFFNVIGVGEYARILPRGN